MASLTGFTLPEIKDSDLNDEKQRRQILEYLYQLTEQLRFTLSNLDEENFSDSVSDNIQGAYTAASSASKEVKDMISDMVEKQREEKRISAREFMADGGYDESDIDV